jgi:hypothetical protein
MSTGAVFTRMIGYGLVLSAVDAVAGRMLQAAPDPSYLLALGATAWAAYRLAEGGQGRIAVPAGIVLWLAFMGGFVLWARALVGWNGSAPWQPRSAAWAAWFGVSALVVAFAGQFGGTRAAKRAATRSAERTA